MIEIERSETADTRTCDFSTVTKDQLLKSSKQHIEDVKKGVEFFSMLLTSSAIIHDCDKLSDIDSFYKDFKTGFKQTSWWDRHRKIGRHHLIQKDGIPDDVDLIDVLEMVVDCVMAGMARSDKIYPPTIAPETLIKAFDNTAKLLRKNVVVKKGRSTEMTPEQITDDLIEKCAEAVHKAYCNYHLSNKGVAYWTKGDYSLLDEDTKQIDRETVKAVLNVLIAEDV